MAAGCEDAELVTACHVAVLRALEYAGNRILVRGRRSLRGQHTTCPTHLIHTVVPIHHADLDEVVKPAAWTVLRAAVPDHADCLEPILDRYVRELIVAGQPHDRTYLRPALVSGRYAECARG